MKKILIIKSSLTGAGSKTNKVLDAFQNFIKKVKGDWKIEVIDLATHEWGNSQQSLSKNDAAEKMLETDFVIVGVPLYNFTIPATLKAFLDKIARNQITFRYTPEGKIQGLVNAKYVNITTRGGKYQGDLGNSLALDSIVVDNAMQKFLGFEKIGEILLEGLNIKDAKGNLVVDLEKEIKEHEAIFQSFIDQI